MVSVMFLSREVAHREHLNPTGYAQHMILGEFYEDIVERADCLAEAAKGVGAPVDNIPYLTHDGEGAIATVLKKHFVLFQRYRAKCKIEEPAVMGVMDGIETLYASTLYKLKFLK